MSLESEKERWVEGWGEGLLTWASWKHRLSQRFLGSDLLRGFPQEEPKMKARMEMKPGKEKVSLVFCFS